MASVDMLSLYINHSSPLFLHNLSECISAQENLSESLEVLTLFFSHRINVTPSMLACFQDMLPENLLSSPYLLPWWQQMVWGFLFGVMVLAATAGNGIVLWAVLAHRRMRTVTNYFLLNLAVSDLLMATLNVVFNFVYMLNSHWPFGSVFCTISNFIANLSVACSVFTIIAMSVDRYVAVVYPLSPRMSRRVVLVLVCVVWCCGALLASPNLLYSVVVSFRYLDGSYRTLCYLSWPDGTAGNSRTDYVYNILFLTLTYLLPIMAMAVTYSRMGTVLWGNKGIGEEHKRQEQAIKSKQKVVKMLITMVLLFSTCWLPYHVYFLYTYHNPGVIYADYVQHVYLAIYWLAMSNSMYNPFVYYWMNGRFRGYFQRVLCFLRRGPKTSSPEVCKTSIYDPTWQSQPTSVRSFLLHSFEKKVKKRKTSRGENREQQIAPRREDVRRETCATDV